MKIQVEKSCFSSLEEALEDIKKHKLWPTTYAIDQATEAGLHWHTEDVHGYLLEGETYALDEDGNRYPFSAGDKIIIPAGTLHAEGEINGPVVSIVGIPEPLSPDRFLKARDPSER